MFNETTFHSILLSTKLRNTTKENNQLIDKFTEEDSNINDI